MTVNSSFSPIDRVIAEHGDIAVDRSSKPRMLKEKISPEGDPGAPNLSRCHALKTPSRSRPDLRFYRPWLRSPHRHWVRLASGFLQLSKARTAHATMHTAFGARLFATLSASDTSFPAGPGRWSVRYAKAAPATVARSGQRVGLARRHACDRRTLFCRQADRSNVQSLRSAAAARDRCYRFLFFKYLSKKI
ncbi:hypothetical protein [Paraburkholderia strydomiana]